MANSRPLDLFNVALLQTLKDRYFREKSIRSSEKVQIGPQNDDFSKLWPSSRFGMAMAGL